MSLAEIIKKRFGSLEKGRTVWESHWDEVATYVIPRKDNVYGQAVDGDKRNQRVYNTEPTKDNDELADALASIMINPQTKWMEYSSGDERVDRDDASYKTLSAWTEMTLRELSSSNFYLEAHEAFTELPSFGTGALITHENNEEGEPDVWFEQTPIYEWYLSLDAKRRPRIAYRKYELTVRQMVEEFGDQILEDSELAQFNESNPDKKYFICQAIEPIKSLAPHMSQVNDSWKFGSIHVLLNRGLVLRESGFRTFPVAFPRFTVINGEVYGRGPAMKSLPDIKTLNAMEAVNLQSAQMTMAPPLQAVENSLLRPPKLIPYGLTFRKPGSEPLETLFTGGRVDIGLDIIQSKEQKIKEHFFIPQLRMVEQDRMTATEIMQRRDEQFRSLGSVLMRLSREFIGPIVDRVFDIMWHKGRFGSREDIPQVLKEQIERQNGSLGIRFTSLIARAQAAAEAENLTRAIQASAPVFDFQPEVGDILDGDTILRDNLKKMGVPGEFARTEGRVRQLRQERAEAQRIQQQAEVAQGEARAVKDMSEAIANDPEGRPAG